MNIVNENLLQKTKCTVSNDVGLPIPLNNTPSPDSFKYKSWLLKWLNSKKHSVKDSTYVRYKNIIQNHIIPQLGEYQINQIDYHILSQYIDYKLDNGKLDDTGGLSAKTTSDIITIIKESLKYAQLLGAPVLLNFNLLTIRKPSREMRVLNKSEEQTLVKFLLAKIDTYQLGVLVCLYTGIRIGELCALKWKNISIKNREIKIEETMQRLQKIDIDGGAKTHITITSPKSFCSIRTIPIPAFLNDILLTFISDSDSFLLTGNENDYVEPRTMQNHFKSYIRKCNIPDANFHSLRHTFATRCIESGFDAKSLSEILGHSSVKITLDKYVHSSMELKRKNMDKLCMII